MDTKTQELLERTFNFGVNVLRFLSKLKYNDILSIPKKQLAKATSIGANYEEAQAAESKKDFIHKIGVVCKECRECYYWTRVLMSVYEDEKIKIKLKEFSKEVSEFKRIFTSIKLSAEGKNNF